MTKSELMCLMTGGMATLAGGVLAAYVSFLGNTDAEKAKQPIQGIHDDGAYRYTTNHLSHTEFTDHRGVHRPQ